MPTTEATPIRLAMNLFDSERIVPDMRAKLLSGLLDLKVIRVDKSRPDETAVAFKPDLDLLYIATICDIIRDHDRDGGDYPTRVYIKKATAWERIPADTRLTHMEDGKSVLNRKLFALPPKMIEDPDDWEPTVLK